MSFPLAIFRLGAMAELNRPDQKYPFKLPETQDELKDLFREQRRIILKSTPYREALNKIQAKAERFEGPFRRARWADEQLPKDEGGRSLLSDGRSDEWGRDIFSMPPPMNRDERAILGPSIHLVGLLPSEMLACTLGETQWSIRVRASMTACALEVEDGMPKLWWTFEGIPKSPLSLQTAFASLGEFFRFANSLEKEVVDNLSQAYFDALTEVTKRTEPLTYTPAEQRLRIRFADNTDRIFGMLMDTLQKKVITPDIIKNLPAESLRDDRGALTKFEEFVRIANDRINPAIDPKSVTADLDDLEVDVFNVDAVVARSYCPKTKATALAGIARSGSNWPRPETDDDLRTRSASHRLTGALAGREAIKLEIARRRARLGATQARLH